jgi:hypothetical protein
VRHRHDEQLVRVGDVELTADDVATVGRRRRHRLLELAEVRRVELAARADLRRLERDALGRLVVALAVQNARLASARWT